MYRILQAVPQGLTQNQVYRTYIVKVAVNAQP